MNKEKLSRGKARKTVLSEDRKNTIKAQGNFSFSIHARLHASAKAYLVFLILVTPHPKLLPILQKKSSFEQEEEIKIKKARK